MSTQRSVSPLVNLKLPPEQGRDFSTWVEITLGRDELGSVKHAGVERGLQESKPNAGQLRVVFNQG